MTTLHSPYRPRMFADRVRAMLRGTTDTRIRATWRVLLAMPVLWVFTGDVLTGNVQAAVEWLPHGNTPAGGLTQSLLHAGFFLVVLVAWARYLDRRPLSGYGISVSRPWALGLLVGFGAVVIGSAAWLVLGVVVGETTVIVSMSTLQGSFGLGLVMVLGALVLHAAVQQVVFFGVIETNAAEGAHTRGMVSMRAGLVALVTSVLVFIGMHNVPGGLRVLDLAVAGSIFGLLYLHTGRLALGIGAHFGALVAGNVLFVPASHSATGPTVLLVTTSISGILGTVSQYGFPQMIIAYVVLMGWLKWQHGELTVQHDIAQ